MLSGDTPLRVLEVGLLAAGVIAWSVAIRDMIFLDLAKRRWKRTVARFERIQPSGGYVPGRATTTIEVRYEYRAAGRSYRSTRLVPGWIANIHYSSRTWVRTFQRVLDTGGQLMIYYNPHKPWQSAISLQATEHVWFVFGAGVVLLCLDIIIVAVTASV